MKIQCCVCGKVKTQGGWFRREPSRDDTVSHTYCPACLKSFVHGWRAAAKPARS